MGRKAVVAARGSTSAPLGGYTEVGQQRADAARHLPFEVPKTN